MLNRRRVSKISLIFGGSAILMLFVVPIIVSIYFPVIANNKTFGIIYFITFLTFTFIGNISGEKANSPLTIREKRDEKIDQVIN